MKFLDIHENMGLFEQNRMGYEKILRRMKTNKLNSCEFQSAPSAPSFHSDPRHPNNHCLSLYEIFVHLRSFKARFNFVCTTLYISIT